MTLRCEVLGAVQVWRDATPVDVGHARQRLVLAALLMDAGRVVPVDVLADRVWGERAPRRGREALYGCMSRLRQALAGTGAGPLRERGGYRLAVEPEAVDVVRFRETVRRARATHGGEQAVALWEEALAPWRGEAFSGADTPWFNAQRALLDAERLAARLDLVEARLELGQHTQVVAECAERADTHPLDERVAGQLMLALYRCGRQAEALECYELTRRRLAEEMGVSTPARRCGGSTSTSSPPTSNSTLPHRSPLPVEHRLRALSREETDAPARDADTG